MDNPNVVKAIGWMKTQGDKLTQQIFSSDYFKKACQQAFESVDLDRSNSIDEKELYVAVLLLYLQLAKAVSGLTPPTHSDVKNILRKADKDGQGTLTLDEFTGVIMLLLKNIGGRVAIQVILTFFVIPILSYIILAIFEWVFYRPNWFVDMLIPDAMPLVVVSAALGTFLLPQLLQRYDEYSVGVSSGKKKE